MASLPPLNIIQFPDLMDKPAESIVTLAAPISPSRTLAAVTVAVPAPILNVSILVREAGGLVSDYFGNPDYLSGDNIICSTNKCFKPMLQSIKVIQAVL